MSDTSRSTRAFDTDTAAWEIDRLCRTEPAAEQMLAALQKADGRLALDVATIFEIRDAIAAALAAGIKPKD